MRGLQGSPHFPSDGAERCWNASCSWGESQVRPVAPGETRLHARAYMGARHGFVTPSVRPRLPSWAVRWSISWLFYREAQVPQGRVLW